MPSRLSVSPSTHPSFSLWCNSCCGRLERWHRTLKEECLCLEERQTLAEVEAAVREYVRFYNEEQIHSVLGNQTPMTYH